MLVSLSIILLLLIVSAFFSGAETALTGASRPLMHQLEQTGDHRAGLVNRLHEKKDRLIGTILLGNNLVNILATAMATSLFFSYFGEVGVAYATGVMTLAILIFAEILPKTYAFKDASRAALAIAGAVSALVVLLSPITRAVNLFVDGIFLLFGAHTRAEDALGSAGEELRGAIELHDGEKDSVQHERAMLRSVLDLAEVEVGEIMVHRKDVAMIDADQPPETIVDQVLKSSFTRLPLWRGQQDNIVGVLHAKDLLRAVRGRENKLKNLEIVSLAADPWFIPESTKLLDQLQAFRDRREHFALMVDEYGSLQGVVTLEDILEEIVGDISDEHDITTPAEFSPQPDGSYIVDGSLTIRDLNRQLEWSLPDEEAATIAGLILHESRRIPDVGQVFMFHEFRFQILQRRRHQITSIRITPPDAESDSSRAVSP